MAWHLGKRGIPDTARFILKVRKAVGRKRFRISRDGCEAYEWALGTGLSDGADYACIVKVLGPVRGEAVLGQPNLSRTETTYIERLNVTLRVWCRRYVRKTPALSKKSEMLQAALALAFAHSNFCRIHRQLRVTPAMAAGPALTSWTTEDLLEKACLQGPKAALRRLGGVSRSLAAVGGRRARRAVLGVALRLPGLARRDQGDVGGRLPALGHRIVSSFLDPSADGGLVLAAALPKHLRHLPTGTLWSRSRP